MPRCPITASVTTKIAAGEGRSPDRAIYPDDDFDVSLGAWGGGICAPCTGSNPVSIIGCQHHEQVLHSSSAARRRAVVPALVAGFGTVRGYGPGDNKTGFV